MLIKLEKYMEFSIDSSLVKTKIIFKNIPYNYELGLDLYLDANIFYGIKENDILYEFVNKDIFDSYNCIFRLLSWSKKEGKEEYIMRCLKTNIKDKVNFQEEKEYLKTRKF